MIYIVLALALTMLFGVTGTPHPDNMILALLWTILVYQTGTLDGIVDFVCNYY